MDSLRATAACPFVAERDPCPPGAALATPGRRGSPDGWAQDGRQGNTLEGVFERFTDRARRVVVLAQEEARMLNHNYIGTEHILLGLIREGEGVAARALSSLGISLDGVRQRVEELIGQGKARSARSGHIPFTPRAKKVLELSLREALQLGHNYIGTEHILLGLSREGEGVGAQVLVMLGADHDRVRQSVAELPPEETTGGSRPSSGSAPIVDALERIGRLEQKIDALTDSVAEILRRLSGPGSGRGSGGRSRP